MAEITIPSVGIAMEEALVVKWLKEPGDAVAVDDPVAEIETDKATMDVVSPVAGTLGPHLVATGAIVPVGATIVHVIDGSEPPSASRPRQTAETAPPRSGGAFTGVVANGEASGRGGERTAPRLSPRARRLAAERQQQETSTAASDGRFRSLIAEKVAASWSAIPHFTVSRDVDAEPMRALLLELRAEAFEPTPTFTDLLLRALALALHANGHDAVVDVGLAVATAHGVVIPVVRDVLGQSAAELACSRSKAVKRARDGSLSKDDVTAAATSTLSNLGVFGVDRFTGIVALGQTSLLTVGRAMPTVVADERSAITVRTTFTATLNADHRTVDGAEAARLLVAFATAAEDMRSGRWETRA